MRKSAVLVAQPTGFGALLAKLHSIKIGGGAGSDPGQVRMRKRDLVFIFSNLATLLENGLSLPRTLQTLARERSLSRYGSMLDNLKRRIENGETFSGAMAAFPAAFPEMMTNQVRVGERSGTLAATLGRLAHQVEQSSDLKQKLLKKLSYPIILTTAGGGVIIFLLTFVVPQFEKTYTQAKIPLPFVTRFLMAFGNLLVAHGWWVILCLIMAVIIIRRARKSAVFAGQMDRLILKVPMFGPWLRDIAVLQFMEVLGIMMESGFKLVDALAVSGGSVRNQAMRVCVDQLRAAVTRGEKLSTELDRHNELFPPVVSQLVIVGEQTGNLSKATGHVREHLRKQIERQAEFMVGMLEPILTIAMAVAIGIILLAIYMPMFGMIDAVDGPKPPSH
jgi:type II secretory pathway component PulF